MNELGLIADSLPLMLFTINKALIYTWILIDAFSTYAAIALASFFSKNRNSLKLMKCGHFAPNSCMFLLIISNTSEREKYCIQIAALSIMTYKVSI